jgi:hypothetical protein
MARATYLYGAKLLTCPASMGRSVRLPKPATSQCPMRDVCFANRGHLSFRTSQHIRLRQGATAGERRPHLPFIGIQVNRENSGADHRRFFANRVRGATAFGSATIKVQSKDVAGEGASDNMRFILATVIDRRYRRGPAMARMLPGSQMIKDRCRCIRKGRI